MKKLMLMALALAFTTYSAASSATQFVSDLFTGATATQQLDQQSKKPLILNKFQKGDSKQLAAHYSHSSHSSHSSHASHSSHYSHSSHSSHSSGYRF